MKSMYRFLAVSAFALLFAIPAANAQTPETSPLVLTEPTYVGDTLLQPGTYTIRVVRRFTDRNTVQITSPDMKEVHATVLTIPHPLEPNEQVPNAMFVFYPAESGAPRALRTWFARFPDASQGGHDIVYEESRAKQIARFANTRVISVQDDIAPETFSEQTRVTVVTPEATVETWTPPAPMTSSTESTTQVAESEPAMPQTASNVPLIALLGLASLGGALALRFRH